MVPVSLPARPARAVPAAAPLPTRALPASPAAQAIGAYTCDVDYMGEQKQVTFLDTPGHEVGG